MIDLAKMQAAWELRKKQSPDVLPHYKLFKQVKCDLKKYVDSEAGAVKEAMPAIIKYLETIGTIMVIKLTEANLKFVKVDALVVVVGERPI